MKVNFLITGKIRPNENSFIYVLNHFKKMFSNFEIKIFCSTWEDDEIDIKLIKDNVDYLDLQKEPNDNFILENVKERTMQQKQLHPEIESWTTKMYKSFEGYKNIVKFIDSEKLLSEEEIVIRLRNDTIINFEKKITEEMIKKNRLIYTNFSNQKFSDWFFICNYVDYKNITHVEDFTEYNKRLKVSFNAEDFLYKNIIKNRIINFQLKSKGFIIKKYDNETDYKKRNIY